MMLPSIRMGINVDADKAAAIEQWGSLAALKPELFINAHLRNPDTPASNADTPKASCSPQRQAIGEEEDAAEHDTKDFASALSSRVMAPMKEESHAALTDIEEEVATAAIAVAVDWAAAAMEAERAAEASDPACRQALADKEEAEYRDAARKRKAEEMGLGELGEDELLAAEILSGSFLSGMGSMRHTPPPQSGDSNGKGRSGARKDAGGVERGGKRARQASAKAAAAALLEPPARAKVGGGVYSRKALLDRKGSVSGKQQQQQQQPKANITAKAVVTSSASGRGKCGSAGKGSSIPSSLDDGSNMAAATWVKQVVSFLETNGQDLLSSICAHYRIDFCGDVSSIRDYSLEQLAHNAIFNPALPKASGRLPKMLRDIAGVSNWNMTFLKDQAGIYRAVRVQARMGGEGFSAQCRCCSYCGSCFSGRFMKPNAMHQQAGGWKEITERTAAGKYSWSSLRGWRLCVPCFTHWASNGTNVNANRPCVEDLMQEHKDLLSSETVGDEALDPKTLFRELSSLQSHLGGVYQSTSTIRLAAAESSATE